MMWRDAQHSPFPSQYEVGYGISSGTPHDLSRQAAKRPSLKGIGYAGLLSLHAKTKGNDQKISNPTEKWSIRTNKKPFLSGFLKRGD